MIHSSFRFSVAAADEVTPGTFEGRDYLVVPVVGLVAGNVIRPMGSRGPELVTAAAIGMAPSSWDGRFVVLDHPGAMESANSQETLEAKRLGMLFNTRFEDGRLKMEAWLDLERVEAVGAEAKLLVDKIVAGELVEISVGAWVVVDEVHGVGADGKEYEYAWKLVIPDHFAMLPDGVTGACSVNSGCGAPRAASATAEDGGTVKSTEKDDESGKPEPRGLGSRMVAWVAAAVKQATAQLEKLAQELGKSDSELRTALWNALRAVEPGLIDVVAVYPDSKTVIYVTYPEREYLWFRRSYSDAGAGSVSLGDDREQVVPTTKYELAMEAAAQAADGEVAAEQRAACSCEQGKGEGHAAPAADSGGAEMKSNAKELAGRLLASKASPFTEEDRPILEKLSEEKLTKLVALAEGTDPDDDPTKDGDPVVTPTAVVTKDAAPAVAAAPQTEEEKIAALPEELRAMAKMLSQRRKEFRARVIPAIRAAQGAEGYTEAQLQGKGDEELEILSRALKLDEPAIDFSLRGLPTLRDAEEVKEAPDPWSAGLEARRAKLAGTSPRAN